ncbi:MAG: aldehyde-activating protein [Deltaproteobacteria bacterium]|nr:aldehyde-activating protein [Deltaproteobacteria bacterium]
MAVPFSGGCICGAVRYECSAEPVVSGFCHCRDCQRETGSGFGATLFVPRNAVRITGEVKYYDGKGDSGQVVSRGFCPTCGARLFGKPALLPELLAIRAGSLDDPSRFRPERDIYVSSAQPWDFMNPALPKFAKMPPVSSYDR